MKFDPDNRIVQLCAKGMEQEMLKNMTEAASLFLKAWQEAASDLEKFTAAHYLARHQQSIEDKLKWDKTALHHAMLVHDEGIKGAYPSLYLNIGKCYEDLNDRENALKNYTLADSFVSFLNDDSYGKMIRSGIASGLERMK